MKKILTNKPLMYEIVRFVIVGGVATLVDFVIASLFPILDLYIECNLVYFWTHSDYRLQFLSQR